MEHEEHIYDRPRTLKELSVWYQVHPSTLRRWFKKAGLSFNKTRYYFTPAELRKIAETIGE